MTLFWLLVLSATVAFGATLANLTLTGTVPLILDISVTPTPAASAVDLAVTQPQLKVADVTVRTNSPAGYLVTVRSDNVSNGDCSAPCFYSTSTTDSLAFVLYRSGAPIGFAGDTETFIQTTSGIGGDTYTAAVSFDGALALLGAANDYGDFLVFTVSVN